MSRYRDGVALLVGGSNVGFSLLSPDAVLDHMREVASSFEALDGDIYKAYTEGRITRGTVNAWSATKDEWRAFWTESSDYLPRLLGAGEIDDRTQTFASKVTGYRDILAKAKAEVSGPPPAPPPPGIFEDADGKASAATPYIKAGFWIAGIATAAYAAKQVRGFLP